MKAQLVNRPRPASCQGSEVSARNLKLWSKVQGMTIEVGPAVEPNRHWKCGTDEVFPITDPEYYARLGYSAPPDGVQVYACKHSIEKFVKDTPEASHA